MSIDYIQPHDSQLQFTNFKDRHPAKQRMSAIDDDDDDDDDDHNITATNLRLAKVSMNVIVAKRRPNGGLWC